MKFRNNDLVELFVKSASQAAGQESHTGNLWVSHDGSRLMNYATCLVERHEGQFLVNETKYSVTTSKIQSRIRMELAGQASIGNVRPVNNVYQGTAYLSSLMVGGIL